MDVNAGEIAGAPGLGLGFAMLTRTYEAIKNIKVYRRQCEGVARQCHDLLASLQESGKGLEGERALAIADEVAAIIEEVEGRVTKWAEYNYLRSFMLQGDIEQGLAEMDRRIQAAGLKFSFKINMETVRYNVETRNAHKRDQMEMRDLLVKLVRDVDDIKKLVTSESPTYPVVDKVMESLQTELMSPDLQPKQEEAFKNGLWMLHQRTQRLPPLTDLTGQVELTSRYRVAAGAHNDVYPGLWLGKEKVALRLPRLLPGSRGLHKRFEKDLTIWRKLNHPNVVPLFGIFYEGTDIYSVSPWMDNGTALIYIAQFPNADRLLIVHQTAIGLEYLHKNEIVHGDVRADNILIDGKGTVRLSDFGMSKMLQDVGRGATTTPVNPRWAAPELLGAMASSSKETDVWSFAMACLEILTGQPPFAEIPNDMAVYSKLAQDKHPLRPASPHVTNAVWTLLKKCWEKKPKSRPTISEAKKQIAALYSTPSNVVRPQTSASDTSSLKGRASRLGFPIAKRRNSTASKASSGSPGSQPPIIITSLVEEPESITPSTSYSASPPQPPKLRFELSPEPWLVEFGSGDDVQGNYHIRPPTPNSASSSATTSSGQKAPAPRGSPLTPYSDISSQYTASIQGAVTDARRIIKDRTDGSIVSGTLEGLVERLIRGFSFRQDEEFRDVLLSSTVDFVSAEDFFNVIERRFHEAEQTTFQNPEDRVTVQYRILTILSYWVITPHLPLDPQLVGQMRDFCRIAKTIVSSQMMRDKADGIIDALNQDLRSASLPPPVRGPPLQAADVSPEDLAIGLTLLEADKFKQISASDYLLYLGGHPGLNAVETVNLVNDKIVRWAQKFMLYYDGVLQRTEVMTFFLYTAAKCLELRNFAAAVAIATALFSPLLEALDYTRAQLGQPLKDILRELKELINPNKDYLNYRMALVGPAVDTSECVPWLLAHLGDLDSALKKHPVTVEFGDQCLINFERYTEFHSQLRLTEPLRNARYSHLEQYRHQGQLAYVESKLQSIPLGDSNFDAQLKGRAEEVKTGEQSSKKDRVAERKRLGLRKPSGQV